MKLWRSAIQFWKDFGYSLGSSGFLAKKLVSLANIQKGDTVLELGSGKGQVTTHIVTKKHLYSHFLSIENDPESYKELLKQFGDVCELSPISAAHIGKLMAPNSVDIIISTLPLGSISRDGVESILGASQQALKPGGKFIQYQYAFQNLGQVRKYFQLKKIAFEPRNLWPAYIYVCEKRREKLAK